MLECDTIYFITQSEYDLEIFMLVFFFYNEPYVCRVWLKTGLLINAQTRSKKMISILDNSSLDFSLNFSSFTWKHRMTFSSTRILIRQKNLWHCIFWLDPISSRNMAKNININIDMDSDTDTLFSRFDISSNLWPLGVFLWFFFWIIFVKTWGKSCLQNTLIIY